MEKGTIMNIPNEELQTTICSAREQNNRNAIIVGWVGVFVAVFGAFHLFS